MGSRPPGSISIYRFDSSLACRREAILFYDVKDNLSRIRTAEPLSNSNPPSDCGPTWAASLEPYTLVNHRTNKRALWNREWAYSNRNPITGGSRRSSSGYFQVWCRDTALQYGASIEQQGISKQNRTEHGLHWAFWDAVDGRTVRRQNSI